jgi:Flp pilus assembly protein CpaB
MSEGEKWVANQTADIALALRAGAESKPVHTADMAVRRFATKELGKAHAIATLED